MGVPDEEGDLHNVDINDLFMSLTFMAKTVLDNTVMLMILFHLQRIRVVFMHAVWLRPTALKLNRWSHAASIRMDKVGEFCCFEVYTSGG